MTETTPQNTGPKVTLEQTNDRQNNELLIVQAKHTALEKLAQIQASLLAANPTLFPSELIDNSEECFRYSLEYFKDEEMILAVDLYLYESEEDGTMSKTGVAMQLTVESKTGELLFDSIPENFTNLLYTNSLEDLKERISAIDPKKIALIVQQKRAFKSDVGVLEKT